MRKLFYLIALAVALSAACCSRSGEEYVVKGSTSQSRLEGERVFLVPYGSPTIEDSIGVDSTVVKNGRFEFRSRKGTYLARVSMHKKVRYGTQDLLIVTEPGEITVVIDSISSATGTPQNDLLQAWKELKADRDAVHWNQSQHIKSLREQGDTLYANSLQDSLRLFNKQYLERVHSLMKMTGPGVAYDLLKDRYGSPD